MYPLIDAQEKCSVDIASEIEKIFNDKSLGKSQKETALKELINSCGNTLGLDACDKLQEVQGMAKCDHTAMAGDGSGSSIWMSGLDAVMEFFRTSTVDGARPRLILP